MLTLVELLSYSLSVRCKSIITQRTLLGLCGSFTMSLAACLRKGDVAGERVQWVKRHAATLVNQDFHPYHHSRKRLTPASCPLTSTHLPGSGSASPTIINSKKKKKKERRKEKVALMSCQKQQNVLHSLEIHCCLKHCFISGPLPQPGTLTQGLASARQGFCYSASLDLAWCEQNFVTLRTIRGLCLRKEMGDHFS